MLLFVLLVLAACNSAPAPIATPTITLTPTVTRTPAPTATPTVTPTPTPPGSLHPDRLIYLSAREPDTLDPHLDYTTEGAGVLINLYETLVTYDKADPGKFTPLLAEFIPEPVPAPDGSVSYTFVVPRGIIFHNGELLRAEDVAYSLWRAMLLARSDQGGPTTAATRTPGYLLLETFFGVDDAAWLVDDTGRFLGDPEFLRMARPDLLRAACERVKRAVTFDNAARAVTLTLPRPSASLLAALAGPWASVLSRDWLVQRGEWDGDCLTWQYFYDTAPSTSAIHDQANGSGPYQLDHWTLQGEIALIANSGYRQGAPKIGRVEIKPIGNFDQRLSHLRAGSADLIEAATLAEQAQLDELVREQCDLRGACDVIDHRRLLRRYGDLPSIERRNVFFNFALPAGSPYARSGQLDGQGVPPDFFADVHVRRAFNACFNRSAFITETLAGQSEIPLTLTLPDQPGYAGTPASGFDLADCEAEFKAVEITSPGDQLLWDTGFALELPYRDGDAVQRAVLDNLAYHVAQVNASFIITPIAISAADWAREWKAGQLPLAVYAWQEDVHDPHNWYQPYLLDTYATHFSLPDDLTAKYRALIDRGARDLNADTRAATYAELNAALFDDAALIYLPYRLNRRYEPVYLSGWLNSLSMNPLVPAPGYVRDFAEK
jgi:peptide/nickel transport system substrate-binding protein